MPDKAFSRPKIIIALQALGDELTRRGVRGQVFIVGGAAMALAYSSRRVTKDIDAVLSRRASSTRPLRRWQVTWPVTESMPGATGNAIFNATGVRMRTLPFTAARVLAALAGAA